VAFPGSPIAREKAAEAERKLARERDRAAASTLKAAERERTTRANRRRDIAANALIGAGFPLLFGQGFGAAAGGGLGGGLGAFGGGTFGFAGSIVGTAVGAAFDTAIKKAQDLATAIDAPVKNFDVLKQSALLSSKALEKQVEALIETGRYSEAAALIQQDLANSYRDIGSAKELAAQTDELNRTWSRLTVNLASLVIPSLVDSLGLLSNALTNVSNIARAGADIVPKPIRDFGGNVGRFALQTALPPLAALNVLGAGTPAQRPGAQNPEKVLQAQLRARAAINRELQNSYRLITATAQQDEKATREAQRRTIIDQRNQKLRELAASGITAASDPRVLQANRDAALELAKLKEQELQSERQITAQRLIQTTQTELQLAAIRERVQNAQQLLQLERGPSRETARQLQAIQQGIAEARRAEQAIGAEISAARIRGEDDPNTLAELLDRQKIAAADTRARLFEGSLALTEASEQLRDNLREATLEFVRVRQDPQGLNRFLSGADVQRRAQQDFERLLPQFRQAQGAFSFLTGARAPEFQGPTAGVNAAIIDFINSVNREQTARRELAGTQTGLEAVNTALTDVTRQLYGATTELVSKNWTIDIQVVNQAGGASTVNAVTSLAQ
jgi:hypothetical protein